MLMEIKSFSLAEEGQGIVEAYLINQYAFDQLIKELNRDLSIVWDESFMEFLLSQYEVYRDNLNILVYYVNDIPVGFLCFTEETEKLFIAYVLVSQAVRRKGIGESLFDYLSYRYPGQPQHLICPLRQHSAKDFYQKLGFRPDPEGHLSKSLWFTKPACTEVHYDFSREHRFSS